MAYTDDQIKQFITDKGIGNNPYAMYSYAQQYGVGADQVDKAMGYDAGTSQKWIQEQGLSMPGQPQRPPNAYMSPPPQARSQPTQQTGMPGAQGPNPYSPNPTNSPMQPMASGRPSGGPGQQNPYTQQVADRMTQQVNNNLQRNVLPSLRRGQVANGTLGSTRQGIAEGIAVGDTNDALAGALGNLYSGQFNTDRNYGLQSDALDLSVYNANQNWMNQGQQNQIGLIDKMMGWNQQGIQNATNVQNTPMNYWQQFSNSAGQLGGMGGTNSQQMQGNPWLSGLGGAMTGYNLYQNWNKGG
jgi:hypothetical protein